MASFKITWMLFVVALATVAALPAPAPAVEPRNAPAVNSDSKAAASDLEASDDLKGAESYGFGYYGLGYPSYYSGYPYYSYGYRSYYPRYYGGYYSPYGYY